jgi:hypothetical protein
MKKSMENRNKKIWLVLIFLGSAFPMQGMRELLKTGSSRIKQVPLPKSLVTHKKFLTEPRQWYDPTWRKNILMPTAVSLAKTAMWVSLGYVIGIPIFVMRVDRMARGLKKSWEYVQSYFVPSSPVLPQLPDKKVSEIESQKKSAE